MILSHIEPLIFTKIKEDNRIEELQTLYPNIVFTTSSKTVSSPVFPCVYVKMLSSREVGGDLEHSFLGINAIIEIKVFSDESESVCSDILYVLTDIMKDMFFKIVQFPLDTETNNPYCYVARYERIIGNLDSL